MALYYNLPLYKDSYDFILKVFQITKKFDREYKYSLGQDMKLISIGDYAGVFKIMETIGKQANAWKQNFNNGNQNNNNKNNNIDVRCASRYTFGYFRKVLNFLRLFFLKII